MEYERRIEGGRSGVARRVVAGCLLHEGASLIDIIMKETHLKIERHCTGAIGGGGGR